MTLRALPPKKRYENKGINSYQTNFFMTIITL
jgi:hypothetical protein